MKKLLFSVALITSVHAESGKYESVTTSFPEFKKSYLFLDLGLGGRVGRAKPYLQPRSAYVGAPTPIPGKVLTDGLPGIAKSYGGFVASLGIGGDYTFPSSCFVLGGYVKYAFSNASQKFPRLFVHDLRAGRNSFNTSRASLKFRAKNYLSFGTRMGVRCNRHLFVGMLGMSFPSFSGSLWRTSDGIFIQKLLQFKSKLSIFLQLGAEYSYSITRGFAMGLSYTFNKGHVRLSKIDAANSIPRAEFVLNRSNKLYRSRSANFSEILAIFRYTMPVSR